MAERESLYVRVSGSTKTIAGVLSAIAALAGGGAATLAASTKVDELEVRIKVLEEARETAESEAQAAAQRDRDRFCSLEDELVEEIAARVRLAAADAEPNHRRRADTAQAAETAFRAAAARWPCPSTQQQLSARAVRAKLHDLAAGALRTPPPGR